MLGIVWLSKDTVKDMINILSDRVSFNDTTNRNLQANLSYGLRNKFGAENQTYSAYLR